MAGPQSAYEKVPTPTEIMGFTKDRRQGWSLRRKLLIGGLALGIIVIALAVGLGVGLSDHNGSSDSGSSATATPTSSIANETVAASIWKPTNGTTWDYELYTVLNTTNTDVEVYDIDLFDNSKDFIRDLQDSGFKVICYFSAGSYENWRPDKDNFTSTDLGKNLDGWKGEKWINITSPNVRSIMIARIDMAAAKGCNGVDPDNVDGYDNDTGFDLTEDDAIDYLEFLVDAAHNRNLSIGLKNAGAIVDYVVDIMEWSVQEQCLEYDECDLYTPFIDQGKPVFHVEYPKGDSTDNDIDVSMTVYNSICSNSTDEGFSTIIKNMLLDDWIESC